MQGRVRRGEGESVSLCQVPTSSGASIGNLSGARETGRAGRLAGLDFYCLADNPAGRKSQVCCHALNINIAKVELTNFWSTFLSRLSVPRVRGGSVECSQIGEDRMQCSLR